MTVYEGQHKEINCTKIVQSVHLLYYTGSNYSIHKRAQMKRKSTNSGWRKGYYRNKAAALNSGDRLYIPSTRLTNAEYHGILSAVSSTALKDIYYSKNPQLCYQKYILGNVKHKQTEAMLIGAATHSLILEPKNFKREFVVWEGGRKAGGEFKAFKEYHCDKDILTKTQYEEIKILRDAVYACPEAAQLLSGGEAEVSCFFRDEETGILCRARADYLKISNGKRILIDLKTCISAEPEKFIKDLINLGYPLQEALYTQAFKADAFCFIAVEKGPFPTVQVYTLNSIFNECGNFILRQALEQWAECLKTGVWPKYAPNVSELTPPEWWINKVLTYE